MNTNHDWAAIVGESEQRLKLRSIVFAMQLFEQRGRHGGDPAHRRPQAVHTLSQVVGQASRLGWTVVITADDLVGAQCRAVGLGAAKTEGWYAGGQVQTGVDAPRGRGGAPGGHGPARPWAATRRGGGAAGGRQADQPRHRALLCDAR